MTTYEAALIVLYTATNLCLVVVVGLVTLPFAFSFITIPIRAALYANAYGVTFREAFYAVRALDKLERALHRECGKAMREAMREAMRKNTEACFARVRNRSM